MDLDARVRTEIKPFKGKVWVYAKNLETGAIYSLDGDQRLSNILIESLGR